MMLAKRVAANLLADFFSLFPLNQAHFQACFGDGFRG
jgi:hypothetical protein